MGIAERRVREKEALRTKIVEAARDLLSAHGVNGVSMRSIADRIEYAPATIYLYFRDKEELLDEVIAEGFDLLEERMAANLAGLGPDADAAQQLRVLGRSYARFALEHTAYFRVMFELPTTPHLVGSPEGDPHPQDRLRREVLVQTIQQAIDAGLYAIEDAETGALIAWGLLHGIASLYLSAHLPASIDSHERFMELTESAMRMLASSWARTETPSPDRPYGVVPGASGGARVEQSRCGANADLQGSNLTERAGEVA